MSVVSRKRKKVSSFSRPDTTTINLYQTVWLLTFKATHYFTLEPLHLLLHSKRSTFVFICLLSSICDICTTTPILKMSGTLSLLLAAQKQTNKKPNAKHTPPPPPKKKKSTHKYRPQNPTPKKNQNKKTRNKRRTLCTFKDHVRKRIFPCS